MNHTLYFLQFTPKPNKHEPSGKLAEAINRDLEALKTSRKFNAASTGLLVQAGLGFL